MADNGKYRLSVSVVFRTDPAGLRSDDAADQELSSIRLPVASSGQLMIVPC